MEDIEDYLEEIRDRITEQIEKKKKEKEQKKYLNINDDEQNMLSESDNQTSVGIYEKKQRFYEEIEKNKI